MLACGHGGMGGGGCVQRRWMTHVCVCVSCKSLNSPPLKSISATLHLQLKAAGATGLDFRKIKSTLQKRDDEVGGERKQLWLNNNKKEKKSESKINRISRNQTEKMT